MAAELAARLGGLSLQQHDELPTSAISLISHAHGRARRAERGIDRRELQEAVKYGRKEPANPGRDGKVRWRYTHKGVVYVTDETSRHEITSWRMADAADCPAVPPPLGGGGGLARAHIVVIVDHSGSMRKEDVPPYSTRTAAVYDCLARDLVEPQMKANQAAGAAAGGVEVSLIEMSDAATLLLSRYNADEVLLEYIKSCKSSRAAHHGNYLPALDAALELLRKDAYRDNQLFIVFLSDGAPSDHNWMTCLHGVQVWQPDPDAQTAFINGKPKLRQCPASKLGAKGCRALLQQKVLNDCVEKVKRIGDLLGRDRVSINTVAFGPPDDDYKVLEAMAAALPRGQFQKLGLSAASLRTAFTSLTSTLTSLRTDAAGGAPLTRRTDLILKAERKALEESQTVHNGVGWDVYTGRHCLAKKRWSLDLMRWESVPYTGTTSTSSVDLATGTTYGLARPTHIFAEGAERVVFQCSEVVSKDGGTTAVCVGPRLVAKATRYQEKLYEDDFHHTFCRTQGEAEELAQLFNQRLAAGRSAWQVRFLPCHVYTLVDSRYSHQRNGHVDVLVEEELDGRFTKWNNNAGGVYRRGAAPEKAAPNTVGGGALLGAIVEDDDEDEEEDGDGGADASGADCADDVPQAFSHFTYSVTQGQKLVCDLQGVWNPTDGFTLTDPVIHHHAGKKRNGATDKGPEGMRSFFASHTCNALCRRLDLKPGPGQGVQQQQQQPAKPAVSSAPVQPSARPPAWSLPAAAPAAPSHPAAASSSQSTSVAARATTTATSSGSSSYPYYATAGAATRPAAAPTTTTSSYGNSGSHAAYNYDSYNQEYERRRAEERRTAELRRWVEERRWAEEKKPSLCVIC